MLKVVRVRWSILLTARLDGRALHPVLVNVALAHLGQKVSHKCLGKVHSRVAWETTIRQLPVREE